MKNAMKLIWYYLKRSGGFLGIQLAMAFLGFMLLLIPSDAAHVALGVAVILLNGFLYFIIGKSAALKDFKYKRINLAKFGDKAPYYEACKEMKLSKAIITVAVFYVITLIFALIGSFADIVIIRGIINFAFIGILLIASGTGFNTTVNGVFEEGVQTVAGRPYLFTALFMPLIFAICACYFLGYFISMRTRNKQHREIQDEIEMFKELRN